MTLEHAPDAAAGDPPRAVPPLADETKARALSFTVPGRAQPGGSKRALPYRGKPGGRPIIVDANPDVGPWKERVALFAFKAMHGEPILDGPLHLGLEVVLVRPAGHIGARGIRPSAPRHPAVKPDLTKYLRAIEDALSGIVWRDDAQVCLQTCAKLYGLSDSVTITVRQLIP